MRFVEAKSRSEQGQTKLESAMALAWFAVAAAGAWLLYREPIAQTSRAMWEFFFGAGAG